MSILLTMLTPLCLLQSVEYRSPAGVEYRSQRDTGAIARAESALAADPRNVDRIIQLGIAQSGVRQYREAIETFSRGLKIAPHNALLYRWRGHRYLSTRQFDRAMDDLIHGARLDSTIYGIWYHLGIVRFAKGDFVGAVNGNAYMQRLRLYRGQVAPDSVLTPADTSDITVATLSYGIGNWYLVRGDTTRARAWFERSIESGGWPAFGFIMSEIELRRLRPARH